MIIQIRSEGGLSASINNRPLIFSRFTLIQTAFGLAKGSHPLLTLTYKGVNCRIHELIEQLPREIKSQMPIEYFYSYSHSSMLLVIHFPVDGVSSSFFRTKIDPSFIAYLRGYLG